MDKIKPQTLFKSIKKKISKMLTRITIITTINMHMRYVKFNEKRCIFNTIMYRVAEYKIYFKKQKSFRIPMLSMCPSRSRLNLRSDWKSKLSIFISTYTSGKELNTTLCFNWHEMINVSTENYVWTKRNNFEFVITN